MNETLETRIAALEAVINKNSITLVDENNPNQALILRFDNGSFKTIKRTITITEEEQNLTEITLEP